ncbi:MAG: sugar ABC transporter permease, partial [Bradyrhizobium sp.]|nr:sugar ABC transporter permease [Bradyrhizobium sp.]
MSTIVEQVSGAASEAAAPERALRPPSYWPFVVPALVTVLAVII